jgi:hypothetical protein
MPAMEDAVNAVRFVRTQMGVRSTNRTIDKEDKPAGEALAKLVTAAQLKLQDDPDFGPTVARAQATMELRIGNCDELSALAFAYLAERNTARPIEIISVVDGDHAFVVIGRSGSSSAGNWRNWDNSVVLCDPWAELCYTKSELAQNLEKIAAFCIDKPSDWPDRKVIKETIMIDGQSIESTRSTGFNWYSVKDLLKKQSDVNAINLEQVALLESGTWSYKVTGSGS